MSYYLINPGGRVVATEDATEYNNLIGKGFKVPSPEQINEFIAGRAATITDIQKNRELQKNEDTVYMATVSQGGKDGYGIASEKLIRELKDLGVKVSRTKDNQKVGLLFHAPYSLLRLDNPIRVIYTMFESDKIPNDWVDYLQAADLVLVPSKWCQETFLKSNVKTTVVPLGYDDRVFTYQERKRKKTDDFVFLHYNAYNIRKGFPEVLKAFTKAFRTDEPVKLVFKTTLDTVPLPLPPSQYPNIKVINGAVSDQELAELCAKSDAFVFPSRGEGFGMTPLEAMATGLPTIVPNAHGITEYFNSDYMYEVKVAEECPALYSRYKGQDVGNMVICDVDDLAKQMRFIYDHRDEAKRVGREAAEYVKAWTYKNTATKLKEIFDELARRPAVQRPLRNVLDLELIS